MKKTLLIILSIALFDFSLSQCFGPETFVDFDNNGFWTANETLTNDCNGNGIYDDDSCQIPCDFELKIDSIINNGDNTYTIPLFFRSSVDVYGYQFNFISSTSKVYSEFWIS